MAADVRGEIGLPKCLKGLQPGTVDATFFLYEKEGCTHESFAPSPPIGVVHKLGTREEMVGTRSRAEGFGMLYLHIVIVTVVAADASRRECAAAVRDRGT